MSARSTNSQLFFGVGGGRCGTMSLANYLNNEPGTLCLHEGKIRQRTTSGDQLLPYLTLQNFKAYKDPDTASALLRSTRADMPEIGIQNGATLIGDIAYFYAPFVRALYELFPHSKLIVMVRDGRQFVRSVYTDEVPDPTPVGWPDARRLLGVERFIALGRLRPVEGSALHADWSKLSGIQKNAWLWNETYRLIFDALEVWPPDQVRILKFEEFFADLATSYQALRRFLGFKTDIPAAVQDLMAERINERRHYLLPPVTDWSDRQSAEFLEFAGPMMDRLGYTTETVQ